MPLDPPPPAPPSLKVKPPIQIQYVRKRHRLLDPRPAASVPTSDPSPQPQKRKKTRDLPNLSECHACRFRIDMNKGSRGKNRLHPLYSEWRIVLLCKSCFSRVESSHICSYCFSTTTSSQEGDVFLCRGCAHRVHRSCSNEYKSIAPSSYSCIDEKEPFVCVDCWVPQALFSSSGSYRAWRRGRRDGYGEKGNHSGLLLDGGDRVNNSLEETFKDATLTAQKKIEAAARAREMALTKVSVARKAVEFASDALGFVSITDEKRGKCLDDVQLAFRLHQAVENSPGFPKALSLNSACLSLAAVWNRNVDATGKSHPCGKLKLCDGNESAKHYRNNAVLEPSLCVRASDRDSSTGLDCKNRKKVTDGRTSHEGCECTDADDEIVQVLLKEGEGSCSNKLPSTAGDDNSADCDSRLFNRQDDSIALNRETCNEKTDRYLLKYTKRRLSLKSSCFLSKSKFLYEGFLQKLESSTSEYC